MSEPFVGEIRMFAGNFAPRAWALCDGQLLAVAQNDALFSLLGTFYGGDGRTTFGLPDLRGRVPMHRGDGGGLTPRSIGQKGGSETETLTVNEMPAHDHGKALQALETDATTHDASGRMFAKAVGGSAYHTGSGRGQGPVAMAAGTLASSGGGGPHNNLAPTQCVHFIVALSGIYPSRS